MVWAVWAEPVRAAAHRASHTRADSHDLDGKAAAQPAEERRKVGRRIGRQRDQGVAQVLGRDLAGGPVAEVNGRHASASRGDVALTEVAAAPSWQVTVRWQRTDALLLDIRV